MFRLVKLSQLFGQHSINRTLSVSYSVNPRLTKLPRSTTRSPVGSQSRSFKFSDASGIVLGHLSVDQTLICQLTEPEFGQLSRSWIFLQNSTQKGQSVVSQPTVSRSFEISESKFRTQTSPMEYLLCLELISKTPLCLA